ncbi:MAG: hypothetical protein ACYC40_00595 [Patescibacteria group bacterium]
MKTNFIKSVKEFFLKLKENIFESIKNLFLWISENPMTKTKRFLLLISANPVMTTIGVSVILFVVILAFLAFFDLFVLAAPLFFVTIFYFGIVTALVILIRKTFKRIITMIELKKDQVALIYFGEKVEIYRWPFFGKPTAIKIIQLPAGWRTEMKRGEEKELDIPVKIILEQNLLNFGVIIHIFVKFEFLGSFQAADFENVVPNLDDIDSPILFEPFINEILLTGGSNFKEIQRNAAEYYEGRITLPKLKNEILLDIKFPRNLFFNVQGTTIRIGEIEFQSEREM